MFSDVPAFKLNRTQDSHGDTFTLILCCGMPKTSERFCWVVLASFATSTTSLRTDSDHEPCTMGIFISTAPDGRQAAKKDSATRWTRQKGYPSVNRTSLSILDMDICKDLHNHTPKHADKRIQVLN